MIYLVDTNILSYMENRHSPFHKQVKERFTQLAGNDEVFISILTIYELEYSIPLSTPEEKDSLRKVVDYFQRRFPVMHTSTKGAKAFGHLKSQYKKHTGGNKKVLDQHNIDFIIAGSALSEGYTLVSNDKIFKTLQLLVPDFQTENWAA